MLPIGTCQSTAFRLARTTKPADKLAEAREVASVLPVSAAVAALHLVVPGVAVRRVEEDEVELHAERLVEGEYAVGRSPRVGLVQNQVDAGGPGGDAEAKDDVGRVGVSNVHQRLREAGASSA